MLVVSFCIGLKIAINIRQKEKKNINTYIVLIELDFFISRIGYNNLICWFWLAFFQRWSLDWHFFTGNFLQNDWIYDVSVTTSHRIFVWLHTYNHSLSDNIKPNYTQCVQYSLTFSMTRKSVHTSFSRISFCLSLYRPIELNN